MSALEQLGSFVSTWRPDNGTRAVAACHAADTVGAWIAAMGTREGRALTALRKPDAPVADRVAVNCSLARLSEVDDIHLGSMITPGSIVIPAALVIGATLDDAGPDDMTAAVVAGYDAMVRLGAAIDGPTVLYRGIWPTYFAAPFGVAAVAARLLRLDQLQTAHALANAFIMLTPGTGHHAAVTTARWLAVGQAAARGWQAALAAQAGFTSDLKLADGDFLKNVYGIAPNVAVLRDGLGEIALHQTSYKPWCAARQTMAATQALKEIMTDGVAADAITVVEAAVLPAHLKMIDHGVTPGDRFSHLTSVQYQMAVAALAPDTAYDVARPADAIAPALQSFMSRINVRADDGLIADGYPQAWAAHVAVTTASRRLERRVSRVPGDPGMPPTRDDLKVKFVRVTASILKGDEAGRIFELGLEALARPRDALLSIERLEPR